MMLRFYKAFRSSQKGAVHVQRATTLKKKKKGGGTSMQEAREAV